MGLRLRKSMLAAAVCGLFMVLFFASGFYNFNYFLLALIAGAVDIYYYHRGE